MLLLIILFLILFSMLANVFVTHKKIFVVVSILLVILFYFFLSLNFFNTNSFYPTEDIKYNHLCSNYYNLIVESFKRYKLKFLVDEIDFENNYFYVNSNEKKTRLSLWDTSVYKNKIYLYFGITPVLLFYLPFNLITCMYLTDKFIVFILACFIFFISLFILKKISESMVEIKNIPSNVIVLSIFFVGFCNLLPFVVIRSAIYEVAITTAVLLLLITFCLFYYCIDAKNVKNKNILIFCLALTLCLAIGARPHYVLFVPIFFFFIVWLKYKERKNIKNIINSVIIFLIPCLLYGTILALYNYFRFDSIFEFGWKYQLNDIDQSDFVPTVKGCIIGLKNNLFKLPDINEITFFSLAKNSGNAVANEDIVGVVWLCPVILILSFIQKFLKQVYNKNSKIFVFILLMVLIIVVNIVFLSFFGTVLRYIFEYLSLMVILSVIMFLFYISRIKDKALKRFFNVLFILILGYSMFINVSLLFCKENAIYYTTDKQSNKCYTKIIKILF